MPGMPKVDFPVTTKSHEAQAFFNQGVGQLHGFWYFEAERSFRQVAAIDPACGMAYWGMAMANINNAKRAKELIAKAVERKAAASPRERAWIEALGRLLRQSPTTPSGCGNMFTISKRSCKTIRTTSRPRPFWPCKSGSTPIG